jgi:hypothetical protein
MSATRLPLHCARISAWLAVGMLLFPGINLAHCSCSHGNAEASQCPSASASCCPAKSQTQSCCGSKQDAPASSCCGSKGACQCGPDCHCGCSQQDTPQLPHTPLPAPPNVLEHLTWGLMVPITTVGCVALGVFSQADTNQFQQTIPVSALQQCIALSRFTC